MADRYAQLVNSPLGTKVAGQLGLPRPAQLRRYAVGSPLVAGPVVVGGHGDAPLAKRIRGLLHEEGLTTLEASQEDASIAAVVADLSPVDSPSDLESLRGILAPSLKRLGASGRVVIIGRPPEESTSVAQAAARRALEGITRSIGKELRAGGTANLVLVADGGDDNIDSTARFLLSGRSAYVSGQVVVVGAGMAQAPAVWARPLEGRVAAVTGAARGIGASIAEVLARDGARVVCIDLPAAGEALAAVANRVGGTALQLDVTATDAGARIVEHAASRHGGLDIIVHNAGIIRDRLLANMDADRWASVMDVNVMSILRMNEAVLADGGLREGGAVVCVSSIAGIAGNRGQTNYAASKAGVIGLVRNLAANASVAGRGITVNAVAPGFIETEMTAKVPLATREMGRRVNSLAQGGLPVDVAETIAWLAQGASGGVTGNVVRVCGQSLPGA